MARAAKFARRVAKFEGQFAKSESDLPSRGRNLQKAQRDGIGQPRAQGAAGDRSPGKPRDTNPALKGAG